jgi:hypothetical protein
MYERIVCRPADPSVGPVELDAPLTARRDRPTLSGSRGPSQISRLSPAPIGDGLIGLASRTHFARTVTDDGTAVFPVQRCSLISQRPPGAPLKILTLVVEMVSMLGVLVRRLGINVRRLRELMMKYMMFVATDSSPDAGQESPADIEAWFAEVERRGKWVSGERLRPVADATTVRVRSGQVLINDGPFADSKEWIAGFDVLECDDLDEAIEIASKHPMARFGRLELRPFWPIGQ